MSTSLHGVKHPHGHWDDAVSRGIKRAQWYRKHKPKWKAKPWLTCRSAGPGLASPMGTGLHQLTFLFFLFFTICVSMGLWDYKTREEVSDRDMRSLEVSLCVFSFLLPKTMKWGSRKERNSSSAFNKPTTTPNGWFCYCVPILSWLGNSDEV